MAKIAKVMKISIAAEKLPNNLWLSLASTVRMRKAKSPGQWQPCIDGCFALIWAHQHGIDVHGCHRPGDMAVRMREVLARP